MTIANGSPILAADLTTLTTAQLLALRNDNAQLPGAIEFTHQWFGVVAGTPLYQRVWRFVPPVDMLIEVVAVQAADHTAASTVTVTITGNGALPAFPITVGPSAVGAGVVKLPRLLFDNTKTNTAKDFATTARTLRVWPKGTTITVTVSTTSVAVASSLQVVIAARAFYGRQTA